MTTTRSHERTPAIPEFDLADYMTKALRLSGLSVSEMAEQLGVTRETVGRWINGRGEPKRGALIAWAAITGVDLAWLEGAPRARRYSKPQPSDWESASSRPTLTLVKGGLTVNRRAGMARCLRLAWSA